jgi:hypothetical protein
MASIINASTSGAGGLITTADNSGTLQLQTAGTTAMTINSSQVVNFANTPTIAGSAFPSGAMSLISTQTANNTSSSIIWTGLTLDKYVLVMEAVQAASTSQNLLMQFGYGATPTYVTSSYQSMEAYASISTTAISILAANSSGSNIQLAIAVPTNGSIIYDRVNFNINLSNFIAGKAALSGTGFGGNSYVGGDNYGDALWVGGGLSSNTNQITAIKIYMSSGNIYSGSFSLYGISS